MGGRNKPTPGERERKRLLKQNESESEDSDYDSSYNSNIEKSSKFDSPPTDKPKSPHSSPKKKQQTPKKVHPVLGGIILLMLPITLGFLSHTGLFEIVNENLDQSERFHELFQNIESEFPSQDKHSFRMMKTAVRPLLKPEEPKSPSIINLLSFHEADKVSKCLAQNLANNITSLLESSSSIHLDAFQYKDYDPGVIKHKIEDEVHRGISHGSRVILVEHFDYIPAESILLFHGLCDDTTAPFKSVVFIFTLQLSDSLREKSLKEIEITNPWHTSLDSEQRAALESRIGIGKVLVNKEPHMSDNCIKL